MCISHRVTIYCSAAAMLCGCGESEPTRPAAGPAGSAASAATAPTAESLDSILQSWRGGDKDEAVRGLLAANTESLFGNPSSDIFSVSENDFLAMDNHEKHLLQEKAIVAVKELKDFARYCVARSQQMLNQGDTESARQLLWSVNRMGNALENSDSMTVVQLVGKAIVLMSQEKLDQL